MRDSIASLARVAPTLATLLLLVLGGVLAARWVTYFAAPSESAPPPARERPQLGPAAQTLAGAHLFGVASSGAAVSTLNVKLRGVFAGGGTGTGYAIVNAGGRDQATRIGGEIVPGVTLESVHAGHVVLRRADALERVNLEERVSAQAAGAPPPRYAQAAPPPPRPAPAPTASGARAVPVVQSGRALQAPRAVRARGRRADRAAAGRTGGRAGAGTRTGGRAGARRQPRGRSRARSRRAW